MGRGALKIIAGPTFSLSRKAIHTCVHNKNKHSEREKIAGFHQFAFTKNFVDQSDESGKEFEHGVVQGEEGEGKEH